MTAITGRQAAQADCNAIYDSRPNWVAGTISLSDARYLWQRLQVRPEGAVVEVGTAAGVSTAIIRAALDPSVGLTTYDIATRFYAAPERRTGEAVETMIPAGLAERITFRNPATAENLGEHHDENSIGFLFLDANHEHPWPVLDLLAALDQLRPGAELVLHDVNLPLRAADFPTWGAKHLFDGLEIEKQLNPHDDEIPNIGSCFVPQDKELLRDQLIRILYAHEWEADIDPAQVARILTRGAGEGLRAALRRCVPAASHILVVSKGDPTLVDLRGLRAGHFPQRGDGVYAGYYPKTSQAAIEHLESLREQGARFVAFPPTACWWLDHYADFGEHLATHHRLAARDDTLGVLFALDAPSTPIEPSPTRSPIASADTFEDVTNPPVDDAVRRLFDAEHYAAQAGGQAWSADEALAHYLREGYRRGLSPHPLFDASWYSRRYGVEGNPLLHFVQHGVERRLDPNPYFDTGYYVEQAGGPDRLPRLPLLHYLERAPENQCYHPNPLFRDGFYLRSYRDLPQGTVPLEHWLRVGWQEGRPVSEVHRDMLEQLAGSSRSGLVRGNWKRGTVLFFAGPDQAGGPDVVAIADAFAERLHLDTIVIAPTRTAVANRMPRAARLLVLEDYELAAPVQRVSAHRLLTKSILTAEPLFAVTETPDELDVLAQHGVGTYVLLPEAGRLPEREQLAAAVRHAARLIMPSSSSFHAVSEALDERPAQVAVRPPSVAGYPESLFELARRDFYLEIPSSLRVAVQATPPRRIVIPCSDWSVSGVNASLEALGQELSRRGWSVEILFTRDHGWVSDSTGGGTHMPSLPHRWLRRRRVGLEGLWEALISDLEAAAPVLVLSSYDFLANGVMSALTDRVGTLMWVQADDGDYYEQAYRLGRYCNAIVGVSQSIRDTIAELNPALAGRTHAIPNSSVQERDIVSRRSPRGEVLRIVYAGRLVQYQKRVLDYVELARSLDRTGVPYEITLIGAFPKHRSDEDRFRSAGADHLADGRLRLAGRLTRQEIFAQLDQSDLFVLLSDFEGLPLSIVEAMARGCVPVAAAMDSGIPEVITAGENGLIVTGRDYDEWARQIVELFRDRRRLARISQQARATVREKFTVEHAADRFEALLERIGTDAAAGTARRPAALHWGAGRSSTGDVLAPPSIIRPGAVHIGGLRRWR
jgi:predicted O-methyltransferase YrrM